MNAQTLLAQYNVSMDLAFSWVAANIQQPNNIYQLCKQVGITSAMLTEIIDYKVPAITQQQVTAYFNAFHLDLSTLDKTTTTPGKLNETAGAAAANELVAAILHWQHDTGNYSISALENIYTAFEMSGTHAGYQNLFSMDINKNVSSLSDTSFISLRLYGEHNWHLSANEAQNFVNALEKSQIFNEASALIDGDKDLSAYIDLCEKAIPQYDGLVGQAPDFSSLWFA